MVAEGLHSLRFLYCKDMAGLKFLIWKLLLLNVESIVLLTTRGQCTSIKILCFKTSSRKCEVLSVRHHWYYLLRDGEKMTVFYMGTLTWFFSHSEQTQVYSTLLSENSRLDLLFHHPPQMIRPYAASTWNPLECNHRTDKLNIPYIRDIQIWPSSSVVMLVFTSAW